METDDRLRRIVMELARCETGRAIVELSNGPAIATGLVWDPDLKREHVASYRPLPEEDGRSYVHLNPDPSITDAELVFALGHDLVHGLQHKLYGSLRPDDVAQGDEKYEEMTMNAEKEAYAVACLLACELWDLGFPAVYDAALNDSYHEPLLRSYESRLAEGIAGGLPEEEARDEAIKACGVTFETHRNLAELVTSTKKASAENFLTMTERFRDMSPGL